MNYWIFLNLNEFSKNISIYSIILIIKNELDRYHLVMDALKYLDKLGDRRSSLNEWCKEKLLEHHLYIREYGEDMEEIKNWTWKNK